MHCSKTMRWIYLIIGMTNCHTLGFNLPFTELIYLIWFLFKSRLNRDDRTPDTLYNNQWVFIKLSKYLINPLIRFCVIKKLPSRVSNRLIFCYNYVMPESGKCTTFHLTCTVQKLCAGFIS